LLELDMDLLKKSLTRRAMVTTLASATAGHWMGTANAQQKDMKTFPPNFLWGAATAGYQVEGNSVASDIWTLEHVVPTLFKENSGDANNSLELWARDLDLVREIGLNCYRFSIEWARIEPEPGEFSLAMLNHYKRIIVGCRERGITPVVTFNHFATPRWFAALGGWTNKQAPSLFASYCERSAKFLAADIGIATTLNEPNIAAVLRWQGLPATVVKVRSEMARAAAKSLGVTEFLAATGIDDNQDAKQQPIMRAAHKAGRDAIKAVRPDLPIGVSLSMSDDQAVGPGSRRDEKRSDVYGAWLQACKGDDFIGVQNYDRSRIDLNGQMQPAVGAELNVMGTEVWPASLGATVQYAYEATGAPIFVTENGIGTNDDALRSRYITEAVTGLRKAMVNGVPVLGYIHWSLLDNFEFTSGYSARFGLASVNRQTFERTPKPSAAVLGKIAKHNAI
jgi:beta-glucosidase